jgi:hypothetical protein
MTTTRNQTRRSWETFVRTVKGWFGGTERRPRTATQPRVEGLEGRQVLTAGLNSQVAAVLCQVDAAQIAPVMLTQLRQVWTKYGSAVATDLLKLELMPQNLGNLLNRQGLGALAATNGATTTLARDIVADMVFLARRNPAPSTAVSIANAQVSSMNNLNNLANYNWGGDSSLAAASLSGVAPVGFNNLAAQAGFPGLKIPGVNM